MTIKKVATIAGVSIATVSRFFNNPNQVSAETRVKVQAAIKRINYTPNRLAQNLRRGKTGLIIVVAPKISSPEYEPIIRQLNQTAKERSYNLLAQEAQPHELNLHYYQEMLRCKQADGFILLTGLPEESGKVALKEPLPIVLASEPLPKGTRINLPSININHYRAAKDATQYLISLGHKHIAFLAANPFRLSSTQHQAGFVQAMSSHGLSIFGRIINQQPKQIFVHEALEHLLGTQPRPTAIFCNDDDMALQVMHLLKEKDFSIPKDISVMGFNNIRYGELSNPPLTSVKLPGEAIADQAIELLFEMIENQSKTLRPFIFKHSLVIRQSTTPPKKMKNKQ